MAQATIDVSMAKAGETGGEFSFDFILFFPRTNPERFLMFIDIF